jgi:hypothetical protein
MWKDRNKLKLNGGEGFPEDYFKPKKRGRKPSPAKLAEAAISEVVAKAGLPRQYVAPIARLYLKPRALKQLVADVVELRRQIVEAEMKAADLEGRLWTLVQTGSLPAPPAQKPTLSNAQFLTRLFEGGKTHNDNQRSQTDSDNRPLSELDALLAAHAGRGGRLVPGA